MSPKFALPSKIGAESLLAVHGSDKAITLLQEVCHIATNIPYVNVVATVALRILQIAEVTLFSFDSGLCSRYSNF